MVSIKCKVCDAGTLVQTKKYRMSGPVVFIGYILLIPSVIGMVVCGFFIIMDLSMVRSSDIGMVTNIVYLLIGAAFFVGGLLGWLLIMKKKVLQCNVCSAVVNLA